MPRVTARPVHQDICQQPERPVERQEADDYKERFMTHVATLIPV